ncbi:hypothetical protein HHL11_01945 [Ramlibacter sp. G-1-2-2]|uniref:Uncharacterized protein n=1 Tax=Ramlibacter agri TaxID=2728837 RepID=A0A848H174_9BURK|nr:hypothetical protein [Ramlibacter agri]NML42493.1 hypothetical protein [Ramlibacter agri]
MSHKYHPSEQDKQAPMSGKVENDTNKLGKGQASQVNEGQRTPQSRHDRDNLVGNNQTHMRKGGPNQGEGGDPRTRKG